MPRIISQCNFLGISFATLLPIERNIDVQALEIQSTLEKVGVASKIMNYCITCQNGLLLAVRIPYTDKIGPKEIYTALKKTSLLSLEECNALSKEIDEAQLHYENRKLTAGVATQSQSDCIKFLVEDAIDDIIHLIPVRDEAKQFLYLSQTLNFRYILSKIDTSVPNFLKLTPEQYKVALNALKMLRQVVGLYDNITNTLKQNGVTIPDMLTTRTIFIDLADDAMPRQNIFDQVNAEFPNMQPLKCLMSYLKIPEYIPEARCVKKDDVVPSMPSVPSSFPCDDEQVVSGRIHSS